MNWFYIRIFTSLLQTIFYEFISWTDFIFEFEHLSGKLFYESIKWTDFVFEFLHLSYKRFFLWIHQMNWFYVRILISPLQKFFSWIHQMNWSYLRIFTSLSQTFFLWINQMNWFYNPILISRHKFLLRIYQIRIFFRNLYIHCCIFKFWPQRAPQIFYFWCNTKILDTSI